MDQATITLIILVLAVISFVTEKIPVNLTVMLTMISLTIFGIITPKEAIAGFSNTTLLMLVGVMIVGAALFETGVCNILANYAVKYAKTERQMIMYILIMATIMSAGLSNSGTVAVFIPIIIGVSLSTGYSRSKLMMAAFLGAMAGGRLTLVGDAAINALIGDMIINLGGTFGFFEITKIGLPLTLLMFIYMYFIGYKFLPNKSIFDDGDEVFSQEIKNVPRWKQIASVLTLLFVFLGMIFEKETGINSYMVAIIGAVITVLLGIFNEKQAYNLVSIKTIILLGGMVSMSTALTKTGAAKQIANLLLTIIGGSTNIYFITFVMIILTIIMTQFMSNVVTVQLLSPIIISVAKIIGCDATAILMALCVASTLSILSPIACPPANLIYSYGGYKFSDYAKSNWLLTLIFAIACLILLPIIWPLF